ncbi:hypothetical protein EJB05_45982, partial [Eragrostis curvula]
MMLMKAVLLFAFVFAVFTAHQGWGEEECYDEKILVKEKCMETITIRGDYVRPSAPCVQAVKDSNMICICRILTTDDQLEISVIKILRLARECHKPLPGGTKCGTFTVPVRPPTPTPRRTNSQS